VRTSRSGESALLLLDVVDALATGGVDYAVIGALAASVHGAVRASLDADAVLSVDPLEANRLQRLLEATGFQVELNRGDIDDPISALLRVSDHYGNCVDLLLGLRGMESGAFSRAVAIPFQGTTLKFVGLEDFIAMKAFAGGPLDIVDASSALDAAGQALDTDLLRRIATSYGREAVAAVETLLAGTRN
jgi:hypothetical protein